MSPNNALPEKAFRRSSFTLSMASTQSPSSASSCASSDKYADTVENYKEISGMSENDSISKVPDTPDSSCVGISVASDGKETDDSQSASSDWSDSDSDDEDNYEELMASLPIAFGRSLERTPKPPKDALTKSQKVAFPQLQNTSKATSKENFFTFNPTCTPTNGRLGGNIASEYGRDAGGLQSESHKLSLSVASDCSCCGSDDDEFECKELMAELPVTLGSSEERASATPPVMAPCPVPVSFISALDEHYKSVDLMVNDDYVTSAGKRKTKSDASASDRLTSSAACDWSGSGTEIPTALGRTKEQRKKQGTAAHPRLQTEGPSSVQVSSFVRSEENGTKSVEIDPTIYLARAPFDGPLAVCNTASHNGDDEGTQGESEWGGSCTCSSNWSSGDDDVDDEYEKLLAELPIDVGRSKEQPKRHTITASHSDQSGKVAPSEKDWACIADLTEFSKDCEEFHNSFNKHPNLKVVHSSSDDTHQGSSISSHDGKIDCRSQGESDRGTSSAYSSYCSGNGDEDGFEDLMSELPIALGPSRKHTKKNSVSSGKLQILSSDQAPSCIITSLEDFKSADVRPVVKLSYPAPPPEVMNPMEGLTMFQHIRSDLEKVGRMIVAQKDGELFLQRARILASINWLAASVPTCVLDHLGREIRLSLQAKSEAKDKDERFNSLDISDDVSEASTLSDSDDGGDNSVVDQYPVSSLNDKKQRKACRRVSYIGTMDVEGIDTKGSTVPYVCYFKGAVMFGELLLCDQTMFVHHIPSSNAFSPSCDSFQNS